MVRRRIEDGAELLARALQEAHAIDRALAERLCDVARQCTDAALRRAVERYVDAARDNVDRTEGLLDRSRAGPGHPALQGLLDEVDDVMDATADPLLRDLALGATVVAIERFETGRHRCLRDWAGRFGHAAAARVAARNGVELDAVREMLDAAVGDLPTPRATAA